MKILTVYRFGNSLYNHGFSRAARLVSVFIRLIFSAEIPSSCKLGKDVVLKHGGLGVVLHDRVVVGDNSVIFHNVTIGGRSGLGVPVIGKNVVIGCGAVILGPVKISDGARIGANATVLKDIPANITVVGPLAEPK